MSRTRKVSQLLMEALEHRICMSVSGVTESGDALLTTPVVTAVQNNADANSNLAVSSSNVSKTPVTKVNAPTNLVNSDSTTNSITLTWQNNASDATGFVVESSTNGKYFWMTSIVIAAGSTAGVNYTAEVTGLAQNTTFYYRVRALRGGTVSDVSAVVSAKTKLVVNAPSQLTAKVASSSEIDLSWTNNASDATSFKIEASSNGTSGWTSVGTLSVGTKVTTSYSFAVTGLTSGTKYYYRVYAVRGTTQSAASSVVNATTLVPTPTPTPAVTSDVTITTNQLGTLTQLAIIGTSAYDSILVTQSGSVITIVDNGKSHKVTGNFGEIMIQRSGGGDSITIDASVNINTLIYAGAGGTTIVDRGTGQNVLVSLGNSAVDTLTGNGSNTSFWGDSNDVINASSTETAAGQVHRISAFYQPFTTVTTSSSYIPLAISGQNLADPTDSGTEIHLSGVSLWGTGPVAADVNQGSVGDCYFLSSLSSLANQSANKLRELAVDLGDGTYAVQFTRNGVKSYVRVDADFASGPWSGLKYDHPGANGSIWSLVMEKAYAFFRTAQNTYASLNSGWMGNVFSDFGINSTNIMLTNTISSVFNTISASLSSGHAVTIATNSTIVGGASLIGNHAYSVMSVGYNSSGQMYFTLRNPWGTDGAGNDGNPNDGIVTITAQQLQANFTYGAMVV